MTLPSSAADSPRARHGLVAAGAAAAVLAVAAGGASGALRGVHVPLQVFGVVSVLALLGGAVACVLGARRREGARRTAWHCFAAMLLLWGLGDALWMPFGLAGIDTTALWTQLLYAAGTPFAVAGLLLVPHERWERRSGARVLLDVAVLVACFLVIGELVVVRPLLDATDTVFQVAGVVWPVASAVLASLAFGVARRAGSSSPELTLVAVGFAAWAVADTWLAAEVLLGAEAASMGVQLVLVSAPVALGLAAWSPGGRRVGEGPGRQSPLSRLAAAGPDVAVVAAGVTCIVVGVAGAVDRALVGTLVGLALLRFCVQAVDAERLRELLEGRVDASAATLGAVSAQLEAIVDSVDDGILGLRSDGVVAFVNPAAARILASSPEALLGRAVCEAVIGVPREACALTAAVERGERVHRQETRFVTRAGRLVPVELSATPVSSRLAGSALSCVVTFSDVTDRRVVEQTKQQFVTSVSHELRTPLAAIRGSLEMLADGDAGALTPTAHRLVETAERGALRLGRLVDDLLEVERIANGTFGVSVRPTEVRQVVLDVVSALGDWAMSEQVLLRTGVVEGLALADARRVEQALTNLVANGVKFSDPGGVVHLSAETRGREVVVEVRDDGRGIPAPELPHVFERFRQVDQGDATEHGGTGLGLAITRSIVERHGGRIWVESMVGRGSTFRFTLPVAVSPDAGPAALEPAEPAAAVAG